MPRLVGGQRSTKGRGILHHPSFMSCAMFWKAALFVQTPKYDAPGITGTCVPTCKHLNQTSKKKKFCFAEIIAAETSVL